MKKNFRKFITALVSAAVIVSCEATVYAETVSDVSAGSSEAVLSYDTETGEYILTDSNGNSVDVSFDENSTEQNGETTSTTVISDGQVTTEPAVTKEPTQTSVTTITTVAATTVKRITVPTYIAKYREEAERYTTVAAATAAKTTKTTVQTTVKTTTVKKTTTTRAIYKGIDVSKHQGTINWTKVKAAGIDFVIIRAGYGMESDQVDANFHTNIKAAQAAGIDCGVYWYSYALTTAQALKEAKVCYNTIKGYKLSYPVAFDIEDPTQVSLSTATTSNIIKVFGSYLEERKYYVSVYSYASFLNDNCDSSVFSSFDVWVAHTNVSKPSFTRSSYGMWQYSHTGTVNGISGNVDLDYSYKYYPDIMKKQKLNGYT